MYIYNMYNTYIYLKYFRFVFKYYIKIKKTIIYNYLLKYSIELKK